MDDSGISINELEDRVKQFQGEAKFIYLMPNFHNPTGVVLSEKRRKFIVNIAAKYNLFILEDDPYYDIRFSGNALKTFYDPSHEFVIYIGSFSKTIGGGVRLGWIVANKEIIKKFTSIKHTGANPFMSELVANYIQSGLYEKNLKSIVKYYKTKFEDALSSIKQLGLLKYVYKIPEGGFYLFMKIPDKIASDDFQRLCINQGLYILPGRFFSQDPKMNTYYRIAFSYETTKNLIKGINILASFYPKFD